MFKPVKEGEAKPTQTMAALKEVFVIKVHTRYNIHPLYLCQDGGLVNAISEDTRFFEFEELAVYEIHKCARPNHHYQVEKYFKCL